MTRRGVCASLLAALFTFAAVPAVAERLDCGTNRRMEVVTYDWELNGFLSWFAGLRFPTHGTGTLATVVRSNSSIATELRIISHKGGSDLYQYQSEIDPGSLVTLVSLDGYKFEGRHRSSTTTFDYGSKTMRREKLDSKRGPSTSTKSSALPSGEIRDVLSVIYYLRKSATTLQTPLETKVYSAGKLYSVVLTPGAVSTIDLGGTHVSAKQYTISATAAEKQKWPGDVSFWLTRDAQATPARILIRQKGASLDLRAKALYTCP
ncbi:MAG: DUF3108 domain-containing protein [Acidobacteria bacterium]|nr:DUF3108 domain-containing protein [Acidobacteriota bacterium]